MLYCGICKHAHCGLHPISNGGVYRRAITSRCGSSTRQSTTLCGIYAVISSKAFRGSPHVDNHDQTFQHVIALGDFVGGMLCTESDEDGAETLAIDVGNRFGRIDGRSVHWVSGWCGKRYSIVYYSTAREDWTERVPQKLHTEWMQSMQK